MRSTARKYSQAERKKKIDCTYTAGWRLDELALVEKEYVEPEKDHGADEAQHHDELRIQAGFVEQLGEMPMVA